MTEFPQLQIAVDDMRCGPCSDVIPQGERYYFHLSGMVECMPCHEVNDEEEER